MLSLAASKTGGRGEAAGLTLSKSNYSGKSATSKIDENKKNRMNARRTIPLLSFSGCLHPLTVP